MLPTKKMLKLCPQTPVQVQVVIHNEYRKTVDFILIKSVVQLNKLKRLMLVFIMKKIFVELIQMLFKYPHRNDIIKKFIPHNRFVIFEQKFNLQIYFSISMHANSAIKSWKCELAC